MKPFCEIDLKKVFEKAVEQASKELPVFTQLRFHNRKSMPVCFYRRIPKDTVIFVNENGDGVKIVNLKLAEEIESL